jgi:DNA polymerase
MTGEESEVIAAVRRLVAAEIAAGCGRVIDAELAARLAAAPRPAASARAAPPLAPVAAAPPRIAVPPQAAAPPRVAAPPPGPDQAARADRLAALGAEVEACTRCALATTRTKVVVGVGRLDPGLLLVGEAPGADEDRVGEPFVGRAGQLLTRILAAIGLERSDVYICNVLKCRPPENRNPLPGEIAACSPYLAEQIALVRPRVIAALGRFAASTLLRTHQTTLGALRGRIHDYQGIPVVVTYHPSALLRYPMYKKPTWEDMQVIQRLLAGESVAEALAAGPAS